MTTANGALLEEFSKYVAAEVGLAYPPERWADLSRGVSAMARENEFADTEQCMLSMMATPSRHGNVEILAKHLSIGETYFFRDPKMFDLLEQEILRPLIETRRAEGDKRLKIWSAGCCSGEETYTLAILIDRLIPDADEWNIQILGTDINPVFLHKAKLGIYKEWSFRDVPTWIKQCYFSSQDKGHYTILPGLKRHVKFEYLNLARGDYPTFTCNVYAVDIIVCRNVLMYFAIEQFRKAVKNLQASLVDGGWLIVSPIEGGQHMFDTFQPVAFPGVTFYCKTENGMPAGASHINISDQSPASGASQAAPAFGLPDRQAQAIGQQADRLDQVIPTDLSVNPAVYSAVIPAVIPIYAPQTPPAKDADPHERAQQCYRQGQYHDAVEILLSSDCKDLRSLTLLAKACANSGELEQARRWTEAAISADKCDAKLRYLLAAIQEEQGQVGDAIASLQHALYLEPTLALAHISLGGLRLRGGKAKEAKRHYACALELLAQAPATDIVPESDGLTVGRLMQIVRDREGML